MSLKESSIKQTDAPSRWINWAIVVALGAVLLTSRFYYPEDSPVTTLCNFKTLIGLPCPSCGLTRSFCSLAKGEFARAIHFNLLGPALFLSALLLWVSALLGIFGRYSAIKAALRLLQNSVFIKTSLAIFALYWVARVAYLLAIDGVAATIGRGLLARIW
jgi:hypothetical protein